MIIKRDEYLNQLLAKRWNGKVKIITGIRRAGKSFLLSTLFKDRLIEEGVGADDFIIIDLDRKSDVKYRNPNTLYDYVMDRTRDSSRKFYILIDEIQLSYRVKNDDIDESLVPEEDRDMLYITFYDILNDLMARPNLDVYVTGSNSKMLSKDIVTNFRDRGSEIKVFPLSFAEYLSVTDKEKADAFEEYIVYHPKFIDWMTINGIEVRDDYTQEELDALVARSPYYKATSNDIDWMEKVRMQGRVQKWVDHSISVTINLPADVTEELVGKLYVEAWRAGCKGCTVYRDGSRSGVLVALEKKKEPVEVAAHVAKRPIELEADVVRFQNNKEKWIAFVGLIDGRPYEIFTGLADDEDGIFCPKSVTHGKIIKAIDEKGNKRYDFQFINKRGYKTTIEGLSDKFNPEYWNYAKLISGVLRYGMPIDQVLKLVGGLELDSQSINTWKMGVERALKKYLPNGTKANGQRCPNCGHETLIYQEGCLICTSCGTSKCG